MNVYELGSTPIVHRITLCRPLKIVLRRLLELSRWRCFQAGLLSIVLRLGITPIASWAGTQPPRHHATQQQENRMQAAELRPAAAES